MIRNYSKRLLCVAVLGIVLAPLTGGTTQAQGFADPAFQSTWQRTDQLVASGAVKRSFYWGPAPLASLSEPYAEGPGGTRLVQYFDKSRMEINNPAGNKADPFYVTNGLLTVELTTGRLQVGNSAYQDRAPADIPLASDSDDTTAPTYATFGKLFAPAPNRSGTVNAQSVDKAGNIAAAQVGGHTAEQTVAYFEAATGHNIPAVFWSFLNASGPTVQSGKTVTTRLSDPWFYAAGLPITEAYWAKAKRAGKPNTDVYIQAFQRRVLTYVPSLPAEFQVQMGNIGLHYYDWRYKNVGQPGGTPPTPAPQATGVAASGGKIAVTGLVKSQMSLDTAALAAAKPVTVQASFVGTNGAAETHTYKGPLLYDLLKAAGGDGNGGRDLPVRYIVATGQGGQRAVISWGEIDAIFAGKQVIVAYQQDGANITGAQGPARLVIPTDKAGARSLYGLTQLEVRAITPTTPAGTVLKITGAVTNLLSLTANDLKARPSTTLQVRYMAGGVTEAHTYKGVSLLALLADAGITQTAAPTTEALSRYVVAAGSDGRNAVLSWGEVDPALSGAGTAGSPMVAYEENGVPLGGGLTRLVVPTDARGGRYLPYLLSLDVRSAAP